MKGRTVVTGGGVEATCAYSLAGGMASRGLGAWGAAALRSIPELQWTAHTAGQVGMPQVNCGWTGQHRRPETSPQHSPHRSVLQCRTMRSNFVAPQAHRGVAPVRVDVVHNQCYDLHDEASHANGDQVRVACRAVGRDEGEGRMVGKQRGIWGAAHTCRQIDTCTQHNLHATMSQAWKMSTVCTAQAALTVPLGQRGQGGGDEGGGAAGRVRRGSQLRGTQRQDRFSCEEYGTLCPLTAFTATRSGLQLVMPSWSIHNHGAHPSPGQHMPSAPHLHHHQRQAHAHRPSYPGLVDDHPAGRRGLGSHGAMSGSARATSTSRDNCSSTA